jgi:Spy/CpxP family protein refolding chaperone
VTRSLASRAQRVLTAVLAMSLFCGGVSIAGAAGGFGAAASAQQAPGGDQGGQGGHGGPNARMGQVLMSLGLSDAQKQQIRDIVADARKKNQGVTDRDQRRATMKAAFAKVDTVLTPAQRDSFHKQMQAMRQHPQQ